MLIDFVETRFSFNPQYCYFFSVELRRFTSILAIRLAIIVVCLSDNQAIRLGVQVGDEQFIYNLLTMIKIGFNKLQLSLAVVLVCLAVVQCDRFNATVVCQPCRRACGVANCFRLAGPGFEQETCPTTSCDLSTNRTFEVDKCAYDYNGVSCGSKLCLYSNEKSGCASRKLGLSTCTQDLLNFQFSCVSCSTTTTTGCNNCFSLKTSDTVGEKSGACLGDTCNGVLTAPITGSYFSCSVDTFGNPCTCCFKLLNYNGVMFGECVDNFDIANTKQFITYAVNRSEYNSTLTSHELFMMVSLVFLLLATLL